MDENRDKLSGLLDVSSEEAEYQSLAIRVVLGIMGVDRAMHVYDPSNAVVVKLLTDLKEALDAFGTRFGTSVSVQIQGNNFFVNLNLLKMDFKTFQRAREVGELFRRLDIVELAFPETVSMQGLQEFFSVLSAASRDEAARQKLVTGGVAGVRVRNISGRAKTSVAVERETLCIRLYFLLRVLMTTLFSNLEAIDPKIVVRIKRIVQLMIDNLSDREGILFTLATRPSTTDDLTEHMVHTALMSLVFGRSLGLSKLHLFHLGMGALFYDTAQLFSGRGQPDRVRLHAVRILLGTGGLGEDILTRVAVCYENPRIGPVTQQRKATLAYSRIVMVVDDFLHQVQRGRAPAEVMVWMCTTAAREAYDPAVLSLFARAFGLFPIGSLIQLSTGDVAVVFAPHTDQARFARPVVKVVFDAAGHHLPQPRTLDLSTVPDVKIARALAPATLDYDPLECFITRG